MRDAVLAAAVYAALTIALTWPLARGIARDVPSDLGDPLLNCWILAWDADHLVRAASGHPAALRGYWNANIFYPHPIALAYSEHLTAQAAQIAPLYALSRNPVLCYNVLFLSTFVLSGVGMYLFARDLTSDRRAAFVAGLAYAFAPYRFGSLPHLPVLSSAWMPFVLFGMRRFFESGRTRGLAGAAAAWLAQNLSCSYYLVFFAPVLALYIAWELTTRRLWTEWRIVGRLFAAVAIVVLVTVPFVTPYLTLRRLGFMPRSIEETQHFAADVHAYLTASPEALVWGRVVRAWPKSEGWLFPGLTIACLAAIGIVASAIDARRASAARLAAAAHANRAAIERLLQWAVAASSVAVVAMLFGWTLRLPVLRITSVERALAISMLLGAALIAASARSRSTFMTWLASPPAILTLIAAFAAAMSFGPRIYARGRLVSDTNLYSWFYDFVPGFDGLRVPARFGMIVAFALAALAGYGAAVVGRIRNGARVLAVLAAGIAIEAIVIPFPLNGNDTNYRQPDLAPLPPSVAIGDLAPPVYRFLAQLPASASILEMPIGEAAFDVRDMFYSTAHWRPLVNGYSGGAPPDYAFLAETLKDAVRRPDQAWTALLSSGASHVVVHEGSYLNGRGRQISAWLSARGAREIAAFGTDRVFELGRHPS